MNRRIIHALCLSGLLVIPAWADRGDNGPPNPENMVRHCMQRIERLTVHTVRVLTHRAERTANVISHLLEQDRDDQAAALAEHSIMVIERISMFRARAVQRTAARCTMVLENHEAPQELIDAIATAATTALETITEKRDDAIAIVQHALGE